MNHRRIVHLLSFVLIAIGSAQSVPILWCLVPFDGPALVGLATGMAACFVAGGVARAWGRDEGELYRREGILVVVGAWFLASVFGAIPFVASGAIPGPMDALFESASGFTTTGASILRDVEALPRGILFWRSMTQWLGGIGIVVLFVALLAELGPGARMLFRLEVPGPKVEIFHARVRETALALFRIYIGLSVLQAVSMLVLGAGVFDALTHTFATVSTGGFSPHASSVGALSVPLQIVVLVFMAVSAINFGLYHAALSGRSREAMRDVELRVYLATVGAASLLVAIDLLASRGETGVGRTILDAIFQVVSIMTTTGFSTADFAAWPGWAHAALVVLMAVGGCAGSTAGGMKLIRVLIGLRVVWREVRLTFTPNAVVAIGIGDQIIPESSARAVIALLLVWVLGWASGTLLLSVGDVDLVTAATASLATVSNIGPGLAAVGPSENFAFFAPWQKGLMVVLMWLGRLEFFSVLALFLPRFWKP